MKIVARKEEFEHAVYLSLEDAPIIEVDGWPFSMQPDDVSLSIGGDGKWELGVHGYKINKNGKPGVGRPYLHFNNRIMDSMPEWLRDIVVAELGHACSVCKGETVPNGRVCTQCGHVDRDDEK